MSRIKDKVEARRLRKEGKSYSEIKERIGISKSTLSGWLQDMPLSDEKIRELRALSPRRIERFRETMRKKREALLEISYREVTKDIGTLSERDIFIAGLYLYWGEGTKSAPGRVAIANTDPDVIRTFRDWLLFMKVPRSKMRARLHLYQDMDVEQETSFWSDFLKLPVSQFRKPHIKATSRHAQTYKGAYGHGTCDLSFDNVVLWRYITMALKYLREQHARP
jgi:transcriptional regulator with XRE-family HTH domain